MVQLGCFEVFMKSRPDWDEYFITILDAVASRSTCNRAKCGALIVKDRQILSTGYAGSVSGLPHCDEIGCQLAKFIDENGNEKIHCIRTIHAEQNAICLAAKRGISIEGATIYVTMEPCYTCAKMICQCGIRRVIAKYKYHAGELTRKLFKEKGIELIVLEDGK